MRHIFFKNDPESLHFGDGTVCDPYNVHLCGLDKLFARVRDEETTYVFGEGAYPTTGLQVPKNCAVIGSGPYATTFRHVAPLRKAHGAHPAIFTADDGSNTRFEGFSVECPHTESELPVAGVIATGSGITIRSVSVVGPRGNFSNGLECFAIAATARVSGNNGYMTSTGPNVIVDCEVIWVQRDDVQEYPDHPDYAYVTAILCDSAPGWIGAISGCEVRGQQSLVHAAVTGSSVRIRDCVATSVRSFLNQDTYNVRDIVVEANTIHSGYMIAHAGQTGEYVVTGLRVRNNTLTIGPTRPGSPITAPTGAAFLGRCDHAEVSHNTIYCDEIPPNFGLIHWAGGNDVVRVQQNTVIAKSGALRQGPDAPVAGAKHPIISGNYAAIGDGPLQPIYFNRPA